MFQAITKLLTKYQSSSSMGMAFAMRATRVHYQVKEGETMMAHVTQIR